MPATACPTDTIAVLETTTSGVRESRSLCPGDRLFVGSDSSSDLCLPVPGVAPTHCVIAASSQSVTIEDCYSPAGTIVDGRKIRSVQISSDAEICIGEATMRVKFRNERAAAVKPLCVPGKVPAFAENLAANAAVPDRAPEPAHQEELAKTAKQMDDLRFELLQAQEENRILQRRLEQVRKAPVAGTPDPCQEEMLELLRAEVLELQAALAEPTGGRRGTDSVRSQDTVRSLAGDDDILPRKDAEQLMERLERLLAELDERDAQITSLTELLALAEEANRSEREERRQMEVWVRDIEQRFGTREQEWLAERHELQRTLEMVREERDRAEATVQSDTADGRLEATQNLLQCLRETAETQRQKLAESEQTMADLRRRLEHAQTLHSHEDLTQLAEERSEQARLKQELETLRLQQQQHHHSSQDDVTLKLKALRQHLNEIHEEERAEREERRLSNRLARLWRRLEGR